MATTNAAKFKGLAAHLVLAALLAGCGGGGSSGGDDPVQVSPAPNPSSPPAPAPMPTPTPAATIAPIDFTRGFLIETPLGYSAQWFAPATGIASGVFNRGVASLGSTKTTALSFAPSPEEIRFRYADADIVFSRSELLPTATRAYQRGNETLALERPFDYVVRTTWKTIGQPETRNGQNGYRETFKVDLIGEVSSTSDPLGDFLGYLGVARVFGGVMDGDAAFETRLSSFSYTPSTDSIFGGVQVFQTVNATQVQRAALRFGGSLDRSTNRLSGKISDTVSGYSGTFQGFMFGPQRAEVAVTFQVSDGNGSTLVGDLIGRRD